MISEKYSPPQNLPPNPNLVERSAWESIKGEWKPLFGNFFDQGFSIEWHEFHVGENLDWGKSFHNGSLEVCLNYSGIGQLTLGSHNAEIRPDQVGYYAFLDSKKWQAIRHAGSIHRFLTIELSAHYLQKILQGYLGNVKKEVLSFIEKPEKSPPILEILAMPSGFLPLKIALLDPPVGESALGVWYQSKILEVMAGILFREEKEGELFCHRQKRANRERVEKVLFLLERDLENPPSLTMLAEEVGFSPFYLSRIFAQETGMSIPKYLRIKRIEKAAEYLKDGEMNVTEAAMAVGYSSLSAFNKAFVEQIGCCPGLYPNAKALVSKKPWHKFE